MPWRSSGVGRGGSTTSEVCSKRVWASLIRFEPLTGSQPSFSSEKGHFYAPQLPASPCRWSVLARAALGKSR